METQLDSRYIFKGMIGTSSSTLDWPQNYWGDGRAKFLVLQGVIWLLGHKFDKSDTFKADYENSP